MIARFRILLPYLILVAPDDLPAPVDIERDGLSIRAYPPDRARLDPSALDMESSVPISEIVPALDPADPQPPSVNNRMNGMDVIAANVLQIDVLGEFDRTLGAPHDPPDEPVFAVANGLLLGLRHLARAQQIRPVDPRSTVWRMVYLNDDETEFPPQEGLYRSRNAARWSISYLGLPPSLWNAAAAMPADYTPSPSATLLLDAFNLLPEIGAALVLAYSAIETRIDSALDILAGAAGLDTDFWRWLTERGGQYHKEPSFAEKVDPLLRGVAGVSLKDDDGLWQGFQQLRKARNSFAHEGVAKINGVEVDEARALELLVGANAIVDWIEALLPEDQRRPPIEQWATVETTRMVLAPAPAPGSSEPSAAAGTPAPEAEQE